MYIYICVCMYSIVQFYTSATFPATGICKLHVLCVYVLRLYVYYSISLHICYILDVGGLLLSLPRAYVHCMYYVCIYYVCMYIIVQYYMFATFLHVCGSVVLYLRSGNIYIYIYNIITYLLPLGCRRVSSLSEKW